MDAFFQKCNGWVKEYTLRGPIFHEDHYLDALRTGASRAMALHPTGAKYEFHRLEPIDPAPKTTRILAMPNLRMTYTYALQGRPYSVHVQDKVVITDFVFSDMNVGVDLGVAFITQSQEKHDATASMPTWKRSARNGHPEEDDFPAEMLERRFDYQKTAKRPHTAVRRPAPLERLALTLEKKRALGKERTQQQRQARADVGVEFGGKEGSTCRRMRKRNHESDDEEEVSSDSAPSVASSSSSHPHGCSVSMCLHIVLALALIADIVHELVNVVL